MNNEEMRYCFLESDYVNNYDGHCEFRVITDPRGEIKDSEGKILYEIVIKENNDGG